MNEVLTRKRVFIYVAAVSVLLHADFVSLVSFQVYQLLLFYDFESICVSLNVEVIESTLVARCVVEGLAFVFGQPHEPNVEIES